MKYNTHTTEKANHNSLGKNFFFGRIMTSHNFDVFIEPKSESFDFLKGCSTIGRFSVSLPD